ncbi:MAG: WGR domain-containing protein [Magnetococcales bacterium]|nr:WGR domain-containing protein [Magnetococcales bacterium]MBF0437788.1 WGR domain-containing protein [Magnetococcales bacterium]
MKVYLQRPSSTNGAVLFYSLQIQRDLLGRWHVIREWGRSGSPGTLRQTPYDAYEVAMEAMLNVESQLLDKGYQAMMREGMNSTLAGLLSQGNHG